MARESSAILLEAKRYKLDDLITFDIAVFEFKSKTNYLLSLFRNYFTDTSCNYFTDASCVKNYKKINYNMPIRFLINIVVVVNFFIIFI